MIQRLSALVVVALVCAAAVVAQVPKVVNGGVLNGKAVSLPKPTYPDAAKAAMIKGMVAVNVEIDENGDVVSAESEAFDPTQRQTAEGAKLEPQMADPLLRQAAEEAARGAKFSPTLLSGTPVRVKGRLIYSFVPQSSIAAGDGRPKTVSGGVLNEKALTLPAPKYPPAAKAVKAEGSVSIQVVLDEAGNVISAAAVSGHPLLRSAAEAAAREAKFSPTMLDGVAVAVTGVLIYNFGPEKKIE